MATLVFSTIGTALGGPLGGAIGALAGRQLDGTLFGPRARNGPRLRELDVSLSSYGVALPRIHGHMRVAGAIIWATELQEHSQLQGGAKGQAAVNAFSYTANLAVAVSSRPITGIGRIWADGKLLRGAAGDLKVGGIVRVHTGSEEQAVDPLIAASEGEAHCPAFRGLAYVVFEALDLGDSATEFRHSPSKCWPTRAFACATSWARACRTSQCLMTSAPLPASRWKTAPGPASP